MGVSADIIRSVIEMMEGQQYDTDAMCGDMDNPMDSNLMKLIIDGNGDKSGNIGDTAKRMVLDRALKAALYSPGVRYFYWKRYRESKEKRRLFLTDPNGQPYYEENRGYTLGQWFVEKKYGNLKEELLHNLVLTLSAGQFASTLQKAKDKLRERRASGKVPRSNNGWVKWDESYGISYGQEMSEQHVMAIMLYTNFSDLCYLFSATYRKVHEYEDDEDMMARHREYAIWGRLLREAVECFGTSTLKSAVSMFYHGVSGTLVFDSTSIKLCGPVSTTSSMSTALSLCSFCFC